jgi:hypothetical protein
MPTAAVQNRSAHAQESFRSEFPAARDPVKFMTVEELLIWAYRDQKVDRMSHQSLNDLEASLDNEERRRVSPDGVAAIESIGALGCRIAGSHCWGASAVCHPDAELVHDRVLKLGFLPASILMHYARLGERPERCYLLPKAYPTCPDAQRGDDYGQGVHEGRQIRFKIIVVDRVAETFPITEPRGRKGSVITGYGLRTTDVLACPIDWEPSIQWVEAQNGAYELWEEALEKLAAALMRVEFKNHLIGGQMAT